MKSQRRNLFYYFLLLSLVLHFGSAAFVFFSSFFQPTPPREIVQLDLVPAPAAVAEAAPLTKTEGPKHKVLPPEKHQIVDQMEKALNDEKPDDARFLSRNNQVVKKQTVAQERGEFKNKQTKETEKGDHGQTRNLRTVDLKPKFDIAKSVQDRVEHEKAFEKLAAEGLVPVQTENEARKKAEKQQAGGAAKGAETSQTLDYIKDLDPGLETLLSTKEFVYYTYFNRIRNQLNQYWSDRVREKVSEIYKKGRTIASADDKITKCLITLDTNGHLLKVQIIGVSGVLELDEAAVEAFKSAAPFPNPPKGMIDADGTIKIRWDFILEA